MTELPGIYIRQARSDDIDTIYRIEQDEFPHPWKRDFFVNELTHDIAYFYVAEDRDAGRVIGYILFWIFSETLELHNIAVTSAYKKRGVGRLLLGKLLEKADEKKVKEAVLEVRQSNSAAIGFYLASGFKQIGERKDYYSEPVENALILGLYFDR